MFNSTTFAPRSTPPAQHVLIALPITRPIPCRTARTLMHPLRRKTQRIGPADRVVLVVGIALLIDPARDLQTQLVAARVRVVVVLGPPPRNTNARRDQLPADERITPRTRITVTDQSLSAALRNSTYGFTSLPGVSTLTDTRSPACNSKRQ